MTNDDPGMGDDLGQGLDGDETLPEAEPSSEDMTDGEDLDEDMVENGGEEGSGEDLDEDGEDLDEDDEIQQDEEDPLLPKDRPAAPLSISFEDEVNDLVFHPQRNLLAIASIDGDIKIYEYGAETRAEMRTLSHHQKSCRSVRFDREGRLLFSIAKDRSLVAADVETKAICHSVPEAHESPPYCLLVLDEFLCATGDDDGVVKVWDYRQPRCAMEMKKMDDYVSAMESHEARKILICTSGEGTLTAFNVRAKRMEMQSELYESELTSLAVLRHDTKVVVGSDEGALYVFNWGQFGYHSNKFSKHPDAINCLKKVNDNVVITGSDDGCLRAVHMFPDRVLGVVGQHSKNTSVEALSVSHDGQMCASAGTDQTVRFWNIEYLEHVRVNVKEKADPKAMEKNLPSSRIQDPRAFFAGLQDEEKGDT